MSFLKTNLSINFGKVLACSVFFAVASLIAQPLLIHSLYAQNENNNTVSKTNTGSDGSVLMNSNSTVNASAPALTPDSIKAEMNRVTQSNDPVDIATFAYVWGFPIITNMRTIDQSTDPAHFSDSEANGPWNEFHYRTKLADANFTQFVAPNVDTLYSNVYYDLEKEPLVIRVPDGIDRYFTIQFIDSYTDNFHYLGTRTTGTHGGTYLLTGPNWKGTVPEGMAQIKSPTNFGLLFGRVLVNGPDDLLKAREIQQSIKAVTLSADQNNKTSINKTLDPITYFGPSVSGLPESIPPVGAKIFDELAYYIARDMPPANQSNILEKIARIGIIPNTNLTNQSVVTFNETTTKVLLQGISKGEKLIDDEKTVLGKVLNGWAFSTDIGKHPDDYLVRSAYAKFGLWGNNAVEAIYPNTSVDGNGKSLDGNNNYVINFGKSELPPVNNGGFWSITLYNQKVLLHDNPINRYVINDRTQGLHYGNGGSLDIYLQHEKPTDPQKAANWFPTPKGPFSLYMRIYIPNEAVINGQYAPPPVELVSNK